MIAQMQALHPDFESTDRPLEAPDSVNSINVLIEANKICYFSQLPPRAQCSSKVKANNILKRVRLPVLYHGPNSRSIVPDMQHQQNAR